MAKDDTQKMPAVKPQELKTETHPESAVSGFAKKVEELMNHAYQQSQPAQGQESTEHHQKFADWANDLGDVWRKVKQHAGK